MGSRSRRKSFVRSCRFWRAAVYVGSWHTPSARLWFRFSIPKPPYNIRKVAVTKEVERECPLCCSFLRVPDIASHGKREHFNDQRRDVAALSLSYLNQKSENAVRLVSGILKSTTVHSTMKIHKSLKDDFCQRALYGSRDDLLCWRVLYKLIWCLRTCVFD